MNINKYKWAACLAMASLVFCGCEKDDALDANGSETVNESSSDTVKDGYFTATLIPGIGNGMHSRAAIKGTSDRIQTLRFMLFKKGDNGVYTRFTDYPEYNNNEDIENVIKYTPNANQSTYWPLTQSVQLSLPVGDYKVVFFGNMDKRQFESQGSEEIIQLNSGRFEDVRINMPVGGPLAFLPTLNSGNEQYQNLFYLATADFNQNNPNPQILLQRLVTQSSFSRDLIDTNQAVKDLVNSVAKQVAEGQLTTDVVKGVLSTKLTEILKGLTIVTAPITTIVDRLVNVLLGDLVTLLNEALLSQISDLLYETLKADTDGNFSSLNILLNPWAEPVSSVNVIFDYLPQSIGLDRKVYTSLSNKEYKSVSLGSDSNIRQFSLISLGGDMKLNSIMVNDPGVISGAITNLDGILLDGLLVNITTPIRYQPGNNTSYSTNYDLLRLSLADNTIQGEGISLNVDLSKVINVGRLTAAIVGDGILAGLLGGVVGDIVQPIVDGLLSEDGLLKDLTVYLPDLAIGNIRASGRWGATHNIYDGTIISTEIGETGN